MLVVPTTGLRRSVKMHNVGLDTLCDWVEGSIIFSNYDQLSASDIVDALCDNHIYDDQDFAWEIIEDAWRELRRRVAYLGATAPFAVETRKLRSVDTWRERPAHAFCLILSYAEWYSGWATRFGPDYTAQGELFERLTQEALQPLFPGWAVVPTGWTRTTRTDLVEIVRRVASLLTEPESEVALWALARMNEAGLDLVCYRPWGDSRAGVPALFFQCASGKDWSGKLHTPSMEVWRSLVRFACEPKKAFSMPYALLDTLFRQNCILVGGVLVDRYRLLSAGKTKPDWMSPKLKADLVKWLEPRVEALEWL